MKSWASKALLSGKGNSAPPSLCHPHSSAPALPPEISAYGWARAVSCPTAAEHLCSQDPEPRRMGPSSPQRRECLLSRTQQACDTRARRRGPADGVPTAPPPRSAWLWLGLRRYRRDVSGHVPLPGTHLRTPPERLGRHLGARARQGCDLMLGVNATTRMLLPRSRHSAPATSSSSASSALGTISCRRPASANGQAQQSSHVPYEWLGTPRAALFSRTIMKKKPGERLW